MIAEIAHLGLVDDDEIAIEAAALELAALDHPTESLTRHLALFDQLEGRLRLSGRLADTAVARAAALSKLIFEEERFQGDRETYDDPANANMIEVLKRRRGLPVSLSIIYVALARRLGWPAHALNTPGHVLVRLGLDPAPTLIDPFNGGSVVDGEQLVSLMTGMLGEGGTFDAEHLAPLSNRLVLVRLLMNQATRAEQAGSITRAMNLYERITTIAPAHGHGWWERARVQLLLGRVDEARGSLTAMLEITREPQMRTHINAALDALGGSRGAA